MSERELDLAEAIREALDEEMARDESVIVFGEDVGAPGRRFWLHPRLATKIRARKGEGYADFRSSRS